MRSFNPQKRHFTYTAESLAQGPLTRTAIRTTVHSDSWFELHGIIGGILFAAGGAPVAEAVYFNLFDEGTGRNLFSNPISADALFPNMGRLSAFAAVIAASPGYLFSKPFYFATPFVFRPASTIRTEIDNRNIAGTGAATIRLAFIGLKAYDLNYPEQSPGLAFHPFAYVADFGTIAANSQSTQTVGVQSDADFDITSIVASYPLVNTTAFSVFMSMTDLGSSYQFEDRPLPIHHYVGGPHYPYYPIRPIRIYRTSGVNLTLQNATGAGIDNCQVTFNGYKIFK